MSKKGTEALAKAWTFGTPPEDVERDRIQYRIWNDWTPELGEQLLDALRYYVDPEDAGHSCGVIPEVFEGWLSRAMMADAPADLSEWAAKILEADANAQNAILVTTLEIARNKNDGALLLAVSDRRRKNSLVLRASKTLGGRTQQRATTIALLRAQGAEVRDLLMQAGQKAEPLKQFDHLIIGEIRRSQKAGRPHIGVNSIARAIYRKQKETRIAVDALLASGKLAKLPKGPFYFPSDSEPEDLPEEELEGEIVTDEDAEADDEGSHADD